MNSIAAMYGPHERGRAAGWVSSFALHGLIVGVSFVFISDLKLAPQPEPFRWNVALVQAPTPPPTTETADVPPPPPAPPTAKPEPPKPVLERPVPRVVQQEVVHQRPVVRETPITRVERAPDQTELIHRVAHSVQTPQHIVRLPEERAVRHQAQEEPAVSESARPVEQQVVQQSSPAPVTDTAQPTTREVVHAPSPAVAEARPVESTPIQSAAVHTTHVQSVQSTPVQSVESTTVQSAPVQSAPVQSPPVQTAMAQPSPVIRDAAPVQNEGVPQQRQISTGPAAKRDYGWLAETLWRRVEQLKRYPHVARMNRWEGKVVLRAVIREDGELAELDVVESSGHSVLDRDAIEIVKQIMPLKLKHDLGQPQVVVHVPISYSLKR